MSTLKCKMCGGTLQYEEGKTVIECEYCGSANTIPNIGDEKRLQMFDRANRLRSNCNFDKAFNVYESIVDEYPEEAEAYWGLVLCKYGIEYVEDPATGKKVPTCHRSSFDSVMKDSDFDLVMEYCDSASRGVYREQAKQIEEIRKGIVDISSKEEPYDVFICYKETDDNGNRTVDSTIAQDVYDALIAKNYKVFFARITLEDKLGQEYEPYIFAALNSAKVMLVFGTCYDYFHAVWVKNEWSRFLKLMETNKGKYLIPCYRDIDAYDMPEEFSKLQAQDLSKIGAVQDIVRGIEKLVPRENKQSAPNASNVSVNNLLKRGDLALEDGEWDRAKDFYDQALNLDAECADAYLGLAMASHRVSHRSSQEIAVVIDSIENDKDYLKAKRFASDALRSQMKDWSELGEKRRKLKLEERFGTEVNKGVFKIGVWPNNEYGEAIKWTVLNEKEGQYLLISNEILFEKEFNYRYESTTWSTCSLREWLNDVFFNNAFDDEQRGLIMDLQVKAENNPSYGTNPGNDTTDYIFLLSIQEYEEYKEKIPMVEYAWWLRSSGDDDSYACYIDGDGNVDLCGGSVDNPGGIRPAIRINLGS